MVWQGAAGVTRRPYADFMQETRVHRASWANSIEWKGRVEKFLMVSILVSYTLAIKKKGLTSNGQPLEFTGADVGIRTPDLLITNQLLYRLSYIGMPSIWKGNI